MSTTAALVLAWLLPGAAPAVQISITATAVLQTTAAALVVGLIAALWPLRRIAALDAATAFRETRSSSSASTDPPRRRPHSPTSKCGERRCKWRRIAHPPAHSDLRGLSDQVARLDRRATGKHPRS